MTIINLIVSFIKGQNDQNKFYQIQKDIIQIQEEILKYTYNLHSRLHIYKPFLNSGNYFTNSERYPTC